MKISQVHTASQLLIAESEISTSAKVALTSRLTSGHLPPLDPGPVVLHYLVRCCNTFKIILKNILPSFLVVLREYWYK